MEPEAILAWIDARKAALGIKSDRQIGIDAGAPDAVRNLRRGRSVPKIATLKRLVRVLGEPPDGLFDGPPVAKRSEDAIPTLSDLEQELARLEGEAERLRIAISVLRSHKKAG